METNIHDGIDRTGDVAGSALEVALSWLIQLQDLAHISTAELFSAFDKGKQKFSVR